MYYLTTHRQTVTELGLRYENENLVVQGTNCKLEKWEGKQLLGVKVEIMRIIRY